jgi:hypothetical protein
VADRFESPTSPSGRRVLVWVWLPALFVIALVVWLVVRALS